MPSATVALLLGAPSGLALRLLLIPAAKPGPIRAWARLKWQGQALVILAAAAGSVLFFILAAGLTGLTGLFQK